MNFDDHRHHPQLFTYLMMVITVISALAATATASSSSSSSSSVVVDVHTIQNVTSDSPVTCQFSSMFETGFYFVNMATGAKVTNFDLAGGGGDGDDDDNVFQFGMVLSAKNDFRMLYSLVCVLNDGSSGTIDIPKTAFVVGANGPANPNVHVLNFYTANGYWMPGDTGENFVLKFQSKPH